MRLRLTIDWAADSDATSMTTVFDDDLYWIRMEDRLGCRLGPDFDDYCFPMDDRLGRRLGHDLDDSDYCFPMDDRQGCMMDRAGPGAADSDANSITTV